MLKIRQSKSVKIAEQIRDELHSAGAKAGIQTASAHEVAERFHVSVLTAHRAINHLVDDGFLYRVRGSGTFVKAPGNRIIRIGLVDAGADPNFNEAMNSMLVSYVDDVLEYFRSRGCEVHMISLKEVQNSSFMNSFSKNLDGILVNINFNDALTMGNLKKTGLPVVVYRYDNIADLPFSQVCYDIAPGVAETYAQLKLPLHDPPVLIYQKNPNGVSRFNMFKKHALRHGFQEEQLESFSVSHLRRAFDCYKLVRSNKNLFRGRMIFSLCDSITIELLHVFIEEDMLPGRDYRLLSYGNGEAYGLELFDIPSLSAIDIPMKKMAEEACRLLLSRIRNPTEFQQIVRIPNSFVLRRSTQYNKINLKKEFCDYEEKSFDPAVI